MKQAKLFDSGFKGKIERFGKYRVPPFNGGWILFRNVFGIMNKKVGSCRKFQIVLIPQTAGVYETQFIVGQKDERFAVFGKFVSAAFIGMTDWDRLPSSVNLYPLPLLG